ncbi:hypothetical protein ROZALSC1DRAFT_26728 [Rozella allomycis CSF55]|uniref:Uncharacterized protein n=1 Tax=Rozella allomycis (strain CSF55) TaxID=988480 RepID=A0A075AMH0_ROZAC|nr:hypothetical protein O9G_003059 [Rozella allomycis CSF55]RKP21898.1 hypothetical protein ROZALSC1DRAFT_26728 [Rozella allomycis CSF55]|eukprot:EPZ30824.1 hypothetical protein O9G_003059 [Rozella allomycis CSF55]
MNLLVLLYLLFIVRASPISENDLFKDVKMVHTTSDYAYKSIVKDLTLRGSPEWKVPKLANIKLIWTMVLEKGHRPCCSKIGSRGIDVAQFLAKDEELFIYHVNTNLGSYHTFRNYILVRGPRRIRDLKKLGAIEGYDVPLWSSSSDESLLSFFRNEMQRKDDIPDSHANKRLHLHLAIDANEIPLNLEKLIKTASIDDKKIILDIHPESNKKEKDEIDNLMSAMEKIDLNKVNKPDNQLESKDLKAETSNEQEGNNNEDKKVEMVNSSTSTQRGLLMRKVEGREHEVETPKEQ